MKQTLMIGIVLLSAQQLAQARPWAEIKKSGYITIATDGDYEPFTMGETGKMDGFEVDLGDEIFKRLGLKTRWVKDDFGTLLDSMNKGKYDIVMSSLIINPKRQAVAKFTSPHYCTGMSFVTKPGRPTDMASLKKLPVAVVKGGATEDYLKAQGFSKIMTFPSTSLARSRVAFGSADAYFDQELQANKWANSPLAKSLNLKVHPRVTSDKVAVAFPKDQADGFAEAYNAALAKVIADGTYARITKKWLPLDMRCK